MTGPPTTDGHVDAGHDDTEQTLRHLVAGRWVTGTGADIVDTNPARPSEVVARGQLVGTDEVDTAVAAAAAVSKQWASTPFPERGDVLRRSAEILAARAGDWGRELAREEGKTLAEGVGEVRRAAEVFRFFASESQRPVGEVYASPRRHEQIQLVHRPVGPVAVITPFNFPIAIPAWKIAPALAFGNPVVWKPAADVPLLAMRLAEALVEGGLPDGVLSLLIGDGTAGARLVEHARIERVSFTGSTAVGRALIERCGTLARPIQTEMGGKNAAAVLTDADLDLAVAEVAAGAFRSTGQKCTATSRVVVTDAVADEFVRRLCEHTSALRVGDPVDESVQIGPLVSAQARDRVRDAVDTATQRPAVQLLTGGGAYDDDRAAGAFLAPAVVELGGGDPLWRDEVFGPVLAVRRVPDDHTALELVNDTVYGLSAAVFTDNLRAVTQAVESLDVGILHINSETAGADPHVPFGGSKHSGFGPKEQGRAAREFFTTTTTVYLKPSRPLVT
ncbi:aldehyde dehydrogenase family protein [Pseudonocardia endophytica]|uniref:Aldehyde dehydrogenase (NAD+) n=1 Tax=Pseudonocardia endophytica TaxID=401976 RepID=A0A4R1I137_PSEEN|nr:aldehyde dehydrogenase family protein [Pseudonocardia endophytica]TCK27613.1 aldehyde dehydrogenase (NAD+) [Pseudonocardia endophytica]